MPDASGIEACRDITAAYDHVKVIMLTSFADDAAAVAAVMAGAAGYLLQPVGGPGLSRATEARGSGGHQ